MSNAIVLRPPGSDVEVFDRGAEVGRVPPMDMDAEAAVLSAVMLDSAALTLIRDFLRPEHFYSEAHRRIYEAAVEISAAGSPVDVVTIGEFLKKHDRIAQVGGMSYLTELLNAAPAVANVVAYARIIHDRWRERQIIATAQRIAARGYLGVEDTQAYADAAVRSLAAIAKQGVTTRSESNVDLIARILRDASERASSKVTLGFRTGIEAWDEEWGGIHPGEVTVVVALPKAGKTCLAIQTLERITAQRIGVALFSQDSSREELFQDLITHKARVNNVTFRKKPALLTAADWSRITEAATEIARRTYVIDDERGIDVRKIRARSVLLADEMPRRAGVPLGLVIVDYIQQLGNALDPRAKKNEYIAHAATELKSLARELNVPLLVLAQQKQNDQRGKMVFGAADSSQIEKECDNRFFLIRVDKRRRRLKCDLIRRGEPRDIELAFDGPSRTFSDSKYEPASRDYVDGATPPPDSAPLPPDPQERET